MKTNFQGHYDIDLSSVGHDLFVFTFGYHRSKHSSVFSWSKVNLFLIQNANIIHVLLTVILNFKLQTIIFILQTDL